MCTKHRFDEMKEVINNMLSTYRRDGNVFNKKPNKQVKSQTSKLTNGNIIQKPMEWDKDDDNEDDNNLPLLQKIEK